jgi:hypothetical protein
MPVSFEFDADKALEALVYIVSKAKSDLYTTLKIQYHADKRSLHEYGRFIAGDYYKALRDGPVPQGAYDIIHYVRGEHSNSLVPAARDALSARDCDLSALRAPNLDFLSASDIECLDISIRENAGKSFSQLKRESHDAAYDATASNGEISVEAIAGMAKNRESLLAYLADPYPEKRPD